MSSKLNIFEQAIKLADKFNQKKIDWAFAGGIAVGIHGFVRATDDIDIIIREKDLPQIDTLLEADGFLINESPITFNDGYTCFRRLKFFENGDYFVLDLMSHPENITELLNKKESGTIKQTPVFVISKNDLIQMKTSANRPKDMIDIESLTNDK